MSTAPLCLKSLVLDRLAADPEVEGNLDLLVLAALDWPAALSGLRFDKLESEYQSIPLPTGTGT